jgi:hypothetical protein
MTFDPTKPATTRDGRFHARFVQARRSGGYIFKLLGFKRDDGIDQDVAYRDDGTLAASIAPSHLDLVNDELP